ncbi:DUF6344 domain-containing protein [Streptomyces sp. NPDC059176]|uniref:DUF6344 domain-containing protein n=1 Tax=unclassified Streptomyces TaxID=2593676 RepID=UPI0036937823
MAAVKVTSLWTAFISLLVSLLASLGFVNSAKAASRPAPQQPESASPVLPALLPVQGRARTGPAGHSVGCAGHRHQSVRARGPRDRSLPPTIKQRIGAEAHGASPSVRHLPVLADSEVQDFSLFARAAEAGAARTAGARTGAAPADAALAAA